MDITDGRTAKVMVGVTSVAKGEEVWLQKEL